MKIEIENLPDSVSDKQVLNAIADHIKDAALHLNNRDKVVAIPFKYGGRTVDIKITR